MSLVFLDNDGFGPCCQKDMLLSKSRAGVAAGLCSLATPEEQQPWCLHGQLMAPGKYFPCPETGAPLGSSLSKACTKPIAASEKLSLISAGFGSNAKDKAVFTAKHC